MGRNVCVKDFFITQLFHRPLVTHRHLVKCEKQLEGESWLDGTSNNGSDWTSKRMITYYELWQGREEEEEEEEEEAVAVYVKLLLWHYHKNVWERLWNFSRKLRTRYLTGSNADKVVRSLTTHPKTYSPPRLDNRGHAYNFYTNYSQISQRGSRIQLVGNNPLQILVLWGPVCRGALPRPLLLHWFFQLTGECTCSRAL